MEGFLDTFVVIEYEVYPILFVSINTQIKFIKCLDVLQVF